MSSSNNLSNSIWHKTESDGNSIKMYPKTTATWEQMDAWLQKMFPCGAITWRGFGEVGTESFVVVIVKKHPDPEDEEEEQEIYWEECSCGVHLGGKLFHDEEEFDQLQRLHDWSKQTADGSLSELTFRPMPAVWDEVASDHGNCMGRACPMHGKCFHYKARRRMQNALK